MDIRAVFPPAVYRRTPDADWIADVAALAERGFTVHAEDANGRFWARVFAEDAFERHVDPLRRLWAAFEARGRLSADDARRYGALADVVPVLSAAETARVRATADTPERDTLDALRASAVWLALDGARFERPVPADVAPPVGLPGDAPTLFWLRHATQRGPLLGMLARDTGRHPRVVVDAGGGPLVVPSGVSVAPPEGLADTLATWTRREGPGRITWHGVPERGRVVLPRVLCAWWTGPCVALEEATPAEAGRMRPEALPLSWGSRGPAQALPGQEPLRRAADVLLVRRRHAALGTRTSAGTGRTAPEQIHAGLRPAAGVVVAYALRKRVRAVLSPSARRVLDAFDRPRPFGAVVDALAARSTAAGVRARVEADVRVLLGSGVLEASRG